MVWLDFSRVLGKLFDGDFGEALNQLKCGVPFVERITKSDGSVERMTTMNPGGGDFRFLDDWYSYYTLSSAKILNKYEDDNTHKRWLVKDCFGRLLLYGYDRDFGDEPGDTREDETWTVVSSEADARNLAQQWRWGLCRMPYVYRDETGRIVAHEEA